MENGRDIFDRSGKPAERTSGNNAAGKRQLVIKKSYEISYAVFRIASRTTSPALKDHLERQALSLLDAAAVENYAWMESVSRAVQYLTQFGSDTGLIHETNKETVIEQLEALKSAIAGTEHDGSSEPIPLDDIFSGQEPLFRMKRTLMPDRRRSTLNSENIITNRGEDNTAKESAIISSKNAAIDNPENNNPAMVNSVNESNPANTFNSAKEIDSATENNESNNIGSSNFPIRQEIRQSAILEKLKQSGNCRMKDLQETLPNCSERTIRYDLQMLLERNLIQRIGSGGPSVFYRLSTGAYSNQ